MCHLPGHAEVIEKKLLTKHKEALEGAMYDDVPFLAGTYLEGLSGKRVRLDQLPRF